VLPGVDADGERDAAVRGTEDTGHAYRSRRTDEPARSAQEKAPNNLRRSGLTLNEAASLQAAAKFLPGLLYRYTLLRGFPWGLAGIRHQTNATWIW
jgi:hypothetical protein